jgi:23S rRNA pseudouridine1911/1915/1917 synthase
MNENNSEIDQDDSDELVEHRQIIVDPKQTPVRIDKFLMDRLERTSRSRIQNAIKAGCVLIDDKEIKPNYKVRPNEIINLILPSNPNAELTLAPEDIPLDVVYEDRDVLVINKPAGLVVHPGIGNHSGTLVNALMYHMNKRLPVMEGNSYDRPGIVHRIDKDTTGLMIIAKNEESMSHLAKQFFNHSIKREYLAIVWGDVTDESGTIVGNIGRHPRERLQMTVFEDGSEGKEATTHYEVVKNLYYVTLVRCWLETGRTHQIRVHMKHIGHTLFNDFRYGGDKVLKGTVFSKYKQFVENCFQIIPRQALHAKSLGFVHPRTNKPMYFEIDLPEDMQAALDKWEHYLNSRKEIIDRE